MVVNIMASYDGQLYTAQALCLGLLVVLEAALKKKKKDLRHLAEVRTRAQRINLLSLAILLVLFIFIFTFTL